MTAASPSGGWSPQDWIALAGVLATIVGVGATLGGVALGARLTERAQERERARSDVETALLRAGLTLNELDPQGIADRLMLERKPEEAKRRMAIEFRQGATATAAREALELLRVRSTSERIRQCAQDLDRTVFWTRTNVIRWLEDEAGDMKQATLDHSKATESLEVLREEATPHPAPPSAAGSE